MGVTSSHFSLSGPAMETSFWNFHSRPSPSQADQVLYPLDECSVDYENVIITCISKEEKNVVSTSLPASVSISQKKQYYREDKENFYHWLQDDQHMAEGTCRSYVSAIRSAERFAEEHGLESRKLYTSDAHMGSIENVSGHKPITPEDVKRFSCELLVTEQTPPAYIWHTAEDQSVPVYNSFLYARALSEKHIPFEFHVFPFGAHGLATCDEQTNDGEITARIAHNQRWIEESQQWLKLLWANH